jgi:hypothetical protein
LKKKYLLFSSELEIWNSKSAVQLINRTCDSYRAHLRPLYFLVNLFEHRYQAIPLWLLFSLFLLPLLTASAAIKISILSHSTSLPWLISSYTHLRNYENSTLSGKFGSGANIRLTGSREPRYCHLPRTKSQLMQYTRSDPMSDQVQSQSALSPLRDHPVPVLSAWRFHNLHPIAAPLTSPLTSCRPKCAPDGPRSYSVSTSRQTTQCLAQLCRSPSRHGSVSQNDVTRPERAVLRGRGGKCCCSLQWDHLSLRGTGWAFFDSRQLCSLRMASVNET